MRHIHVPRALHRKWGLGLSPSNVVIPNSAVTFTPVNGGALAWAGRTLPGYGGWSVSIPAGASKIVDPYYASLSDLVNGDCPDIGRTYGLTVQQVADHFAISATDLQNLVNYNGSVGMPCPTAANPNPVAPGVLTQQQLAEVIATSPPAASQVVPTWAETSTAITGYPLSSTDTGTGTTSSPDTGSLFSGDTLLLLAAAAVGAYFLLGK